MEKILNTLTFRDILKGLTPEKIQNVGFMQVIPLTSPEADMRFVSPLEGDFATVAYGEMVFTNPTGNWMLVPLHTGYITRQKAQDHALPHLGLVAAKSKRHFDTGMCIEQSQPGFIEPGNHRFMILPFSLREAALAVREEKNYAKLWEPIALFNAGLGLPKQGHLEYFYRRFEKELNQFVAEFECVPHQVGAIVLINGQVVGIERTPSPTYWQSVWEPLIRECYGALAIEFAQKNRNISYNALREPLKGNITHIEALSLALQRAEAAEAEKVRGIVRELLDKQIEIKKNDAQAGLDTYQLDAENFTGQMVRDAGIVYASVFARRQSIREQIWNSQLEFEI
ncbi:MAG: hypothetical protein OHK0053_23670 [Microscillaceae bacterium]